MYILSPAICISCIKYHFQTCVTVQDEALLSDWKLQLERDVETMKAQSNIVSIRSVSTSISPDFLMPLRYVWELRGEWKEID